MGALAQAPMRSRHPPRSGNGTTQQADKSIERQQIRVRLAKGQTHRVMPYSSSLACEGESARSLCLVPDKRDNGVVATGASGRHEGQSEVGLLSRWPNRTDVKEIPRRTRRGS